MNPLLLLIMNKLLLIKMTKTYCLGGRHYSNTNSKTQYEKVNPKVKKNLILSKESALFVIVIKVKFLLSK